MGLGSIRERACCCCCCLSSNPDEYNLESAACLGLCCLPVELDSWVCAVSCPADRSTGLPLALVGDIGSTVSPMLFGLESDLLSMPELLNGRELVWDLLLAVEALLCRSLLFEDANRPEQPATP